MKSYFMPGFILTIILISGCVQERVNQEILSGLMEKLNSDSLNYVGSYEKKHEVYLWGGHSGATDYVEESNYSIEVENGQITNYTIRHVKGGRSAQNYYKYYDKSSGESCQKDIVSSSKCVFSEEPIPPQMGDILEGCEVKSYGGKHVCLCGEDEISISISENIDPEMPCTESINTEGFELWDEFNIIYYPENNQSLCYFVTKSKEPRFAFECLNEHIELIPTINNTDEGLGNIICRYSKYNHLCDCTFDPVETFSKCLEEVPENLDSETKKEIISYLDDINLNLLTKEDNTQYGTCYYVLDKNLKQTFCFDQENLIMFAQWGSNESTSRSTNININTIEKI